MFPFLAAHISSLAPPTPVAPGSIRGGEDDESEYEEKDEVDFDLYLKVTRESGHFSEPSMKNQNQQYCCDDDEDGAALPARVMRQSRTMHHTRMAPTGRRTSLRARRCSRSCGRRAADRERERRLGRALK